MTEEENLCIMVTADEDSQVDQQGMGEAANWRQEDAKVEG